MLHVITKHKRDKPLFLIHSHTPGSHSHPRTPHPSVTPLPVFRGLPPVPTGHVLAPRVGSVAPGRYGGCPRRDPRAAGTDRPFLVLRAVPSSNLETAAVLLQASSSKNLCHFCCSCKRTQYRDHQAQWHHLKRTIQKTFTTDQIALVSFCKRMTEWSFLVIKLAHFHSMDRIPTSFWQIVGLVPPLGS